MVKHLYLLKEPVGLNWIPIPDLIRAVRQRSFSEHGDMSSAEISLNLIPFHGCALV